MKRSYDIQENDVIPVSAAIFITPIKKKDMSEPKFIMISKDQANADENSDDEHDFFSNPEFERPFTNAHSGHD